MAQRVVDLSLLIEDNMPAHKLFQRPVITTHLATVLQGLRSRRCASDWQIAVGRGSYSTSRREDLGHRTWSAVASSPP